jgi:hypothetical protein
MKALLIALLLPCSAVVALSFYSYRCPQCGLIQQYTNPGIYRCPSDKSTLQQLPNRSAGDAEHGSMASKLREIGSYK